MGTAVDDVDLFRPQAHSGPAGVHGGVAAAHDGDAGADCGGYPKGHAPQEVDSAIDTLEVVLAGAAQGARLPGPDCHHHRVKVCHIVVKADVPTDGDVVFQLHAGLSDLRHLGVHHRLGEAVLRDAVAQHTAHLGHEVADGHVVTLEGQVIGCGQAGGAAADDANALARSRGAFGTPLVGLVQHVHGHVALDHRDGNRLLHESPAAVRFTGVGADVANTGGQGQALLDDAHSFFGIPQGHLLHIGLAVGSGGAGEAAGAHAVAVVVAHEQLQGDFPCLDCPRPLGMDHHAVGGQRGAGPQQLGAVLRLHDADAAGAVVGHAVIMAEGRDVDSMAFGHV